MSKEFINDGDSSMDEAQTSLKPTKIFFLKSSGGDFSDEVHVLDLTPLIPVADYTGKITNSLRKQVEQAAQAHRKAGSASAFELTRGTFSSYLQILDASAGGGVVAELDMPILKRYSEWRMRTLAREKQACCEVEFRPVSVWKNQETFVAEGVPYMWNMSGGSKRGVLGKECKGRSVPVAEFLAKNWFENSCVLLLDTEQVGEVVALASCVAMLNRSI